MPPILGRRGGRGGGGGIEYLDEYPDIGDLEEGLTYYVFPTEEWLTLDERTIAGTPAVAAVAQGMGAITRTEVDATFFRDRALLAPTARRATSTTRSTFSPASAFSSTARTCTKIRAYIIK